MSIEAKGGHEPQVGQACPGVELVIERRARDLGGFMVGRVLPSARRRMVGPFIFLDEMGPAEFAPGAGIDVRPHPHIGLATVTYLFEGEIRHRDSLGFDQVIRPGDVNWMTAGRGIVHSERSDDAVRASGQKLHGIQSWIALPLADEETAASFHHYPGNTLPLIHRHGCEMRLIAGRAFGEASPVRTFSPMFYVAIEAAAGARLSLPAEHVERALYLIAGGLSVNGAPAFPGNMLVFAEGADPEIRVDHPSRLIMIGGEPVGDRLIWWNFVASSERKLDAAKAAWAESALLGFSGGRFTLPPGETEFIPLP